MRELLSNLMTNSAKGNPDFLVLTGDHGYALFDQIRRECPDNFLNCGISEQMMVGLAAGLAKQGFRPFVYGLSSFVPVRVLEQIKLDVCYQKLPVIFLGDGAGVVYSTLGSSHQCGEDIACLRPLPHMAIFTPCDAEELRIAYEEAMAYAGPSYIRVGKSDRPVVNRARLKSTQPHVVFEPTKHSNGASRTCILAMSSMVAIGVRAAEQYGIPCISIPRLKPFPSELHHLIKDYSRLIVIEEHSRYGGLTSAVLDWLSENGLPIPAIQTLSLEDRFTERCGSYQYALSEHHLSDEQVMERIRAIVGR